MARWRFRHWRFVDNAHFTYTNVTPTPPLLGRSSDSFGSPMLKISLALCRCCDRRGMALENPIPPSCNPQPISTGWNRQPHVLNSSLQPASQISPCGCPLAFFSLPDRESNEKVHEIYWHIDISIPASLMRLPSSLVKPYRQERARHVAPPLMSKTVSTLIKRNPGQV